MGKAARAIIFEDGKLLVMHRNKYGREYFTLVGGRLGDNETPEQALVREVKEETGLTVTAARLVYTEEHAPPYNEQYIYLCTIAPHEPIALQEDSEENNLNKYDMDFHQPHWVDTRELDELTFRTPQLQQAIIQGIKKGFPKEPVRL